MDTFHKEFSKRLDLKVPLIVAPMAGGPSSPELVASASNAGALGSIGAAYLNSQEIAKFVEKVRTQTQRPFAINLFVQQNEPEVPESEKFRAIKATENFRQELGLSVPNLEPPYQESFEEQFEAVLRAKPRVFSFVFGIPDRIYLNQAKKRGIQIIGTATTLDEALTLQESGVDAITLQGIEAGGHRGIFDPNAEDPEIPIFKLLKLCRPKIKQPLIAAGGIMNAQDIQKALENGAQAVQMGTAFLTCEEAGTSRPYRNRLLATDHRNTKTTRVFSGRLARGIMNRFMLEMERTPEAILPFPVQNKFTRDLRLASANLNSSDFLSLWAGSGNGTLWTGKTADLISYLFEKSKN